MASNDLTPKADQTVAVASSSSGPFPVLADKHDLEHGAVFAPRFDANGLITAIAVDDATSTILMVAHMNAEALSETLKTGVATYWSRSRQKLWRKGETSGTMQHLIEMRTDCDQDALVLRVRVDGAGVACHNGFKSCFYRVVAADDQDPNTPLALRLDENMDRVDTDRLYPTT